MKKIVIISLAVAAAIVAVVFLKNSSLAAEFLWDASNQGAWLLPLVLVAAMLDSVHPCSFSILLITIAFLFGMSFTRKKILQIGGIYVAGIFTAYFLIGLGILQALHLFNTPHFMGKLGAGLLITFGVINIINEFFPKFPLKLKVPSITNETINKLVEKASAASAFILGLLVGICQFPCMGGPYLMVIGLLRDKMTYFWGVGYLLLYNLILLVPLVAVLLIAADKTVVEKTLDWKNRNVKGVRFWAGLAMIIIGILILFI